MQILRADGRRLVSLLVAVVALSAVAVALADGSAIAASPSQAPAPSRTVTRADDGKTLSLAVGERFLLDLGDEFNWTVAIADQSVVRRVPGILVVQGAQGIYEAQRAGETALTATGTFNCPPQQPCPQIAALFRLQIVVPAGLKVRVVVPQLAADRAAPGRFTVNGAVLAGPTCPVERIPPDPGCADRPVKGAEIVVLNSTGETVADLLSDADGRFSVSLAPGIYTFKPQRAAGLLGTAPEQVVVVAAADVVVTVRYDTGIR